MQRNDGIIIWKVTVSFKRRGKKSTTNPAWVQQEKAHTGAGAWAPQQGTSGAARCLPWTAQSSSGQQRVAQEQRLFVPLRGPHLCISLCRVTRIPSQNPPRGSVLSAGPVQLLAQPVSEDAHSWWHSCCDVGSTSGHRETYTLGSASCSSRETRGRSQRKPKPPTSCKCANSGSNPWIRESNEEEKHRLEFEKSTLLLWERLMTPLTWTKLSAAEGIHLRAWRARSWLWCISLISFRHSKYYHAVRNFLFIKLFNTNMLKTLGNIATLCHHH